ncbi:MAG TPA: DUF4872 domain-containing protein [Treponemataceae bacterium]|nr:DUF4872 domain-containing protein [Treponemataceae bacterium]HPS44117.1 DUF4872 domain-containing protein [Treponemataceae bacterium]
MKTGTRVFTGLLAVCAVMGSSCDASREGSRRVAQLGSLWGAKPWNAGGNARSVMLPNVAIIPGGHCESSAIANALRYEGYAIAECEVTGGGSALGFMFQKGTFPFLGARNEDMRERFFAAAGIAWHRGNAEAADSGWAEIEGLLGRGVPVILRNDMRFLTYRYGGRHGPRWASFGGHYVTLFGIDLERGVAYVSDTEYPGLQTVTLADLERARFSKTQSFPPHGEFYWAEPPREGYALDYGRLARSSIAGVIANYRARGLGSGEGEPLIGLAGMERYPEALATLESWSGKPYLLPAVLNYMAGNIEDFGTGGASFRTLYRAFLARAISAGGVTELEPLLAPLDGSIASWHALSADFRAASAEVKGLDRAGRTRVFARLSQKAEALLKTEKAFYTTLVTVADAMDIAIPEE